MSAASPALSSIDDLFLEAQKATEAGSKSFYFATKFFPKELARRAYAVYWFCRTTDDLVDEAPTREVGEAGLNQWEAELRFGLQGGNVSNPILRLFLHVLRFPLRPVAALLRPCVRPCFDLVATLRATLLPLWCDRGRGGRRCGGRRR